ncbi:DUF3283 family protein [Aeromonas caviae]|nr:DUF3283 family protein [Aeromonas caviae]
MSFNLCKLPPAEKALIEVDKAAAYAVWKEQRQASHGKAGQFRLYRTSA